MKSVRAAAVAFAMALVAMGPSGAVADMINWSQPGVWTILDPVDGGLAPGRDIIAMRYYYDTTASTHYFRMDLRGAPSTGGPDPAPDYMIQIDYLAGGAAYGNGTGNPALSYYVANDGAGGCWGSIGSSMRTTMCMARVLRQTSNVYDGTSNSPYWFSQTPISGVSGSFTNDMNGGATLEWSVPLAALPQTVMTIWGASRDLLGTAPPTEYDLTGPIHTPEPGTLALMGIVGAMGVGYGRIRRRKKQA